MGNPRCKWVRDRLPLLAGDELLGLDRRRVERHLIGCPQCRRHRVALDHALGILHTASAEAPTRAEAPSLWPALARQIQESRRPVPAPAFAFAFAWPRFGFWPAFGLGLALLVALGVAAAARKQLDEARAAMIANRRPFITQAAQADPGLSAEVPPAPIQDVPKAPAEAPVADNTTASPPRLNYDLDHAVPMGPEGREGKQPTY